MTQNSNSSDQKPDPKKENEAERYFKRAKQAVSVKDGKGLPLPDGAMLEPVRKIPKGIKILKAGPGLIKLRFFSMRGWLIIPLLCGAVLWFFLAAFIVQIFTYDGDPQAETWLIIALFLGGFFLAMFPRVVVVITQDWVKFGGRYYLMRNVGGITTGQEVVIQFKNSVNVIPLTSLYVSYGPWGEHTPYVNSPGTAINFAVYITDLIDRMRADQKEHETEQGKREQVF